MRILGKLFASVSGATEPLPEQAVLIDVRSPDEFAAGHIKDAIPLPLSCLARDIDSVIVDRTTPIIVYCQSGGRSASARTLLLDMGYQHVVNGGGICALASRMKREIRGVEISRISIPCNVDRSSNG
jgi:phage shock protein E